MKMHKWVFLVAYAIYMLFAIVFTIVSDDTEVIDTLIFSVTIASSFFSISDLVFTKFEIDKKETDETFTLLFLTKYAQNFYSNKIEAKYREGVKKKLDELKTIFGDDTLEKIVSSNLSKKEEEDYLKQVTNIELKEFLAELIKQKNNIDIVAEEDDQQVNDMYKKRKKREKIYFALPSILAVIGLVNLLIILTLRVEPEPKINNVCTLTAFLAVIANMLLKECYKDKSLTQLAKERREVIRDIKENE